MDRTVVQSGQSGPGLDFSPTIHIVPWTCQDVKQKFEKCWTSTSSRALGLSRDGTDVRGLLSRRTPFWGEPLGPPLLAQSSISLSISFSWRSRAFSATSDSSASSRSTSAT